MKSGRITQILISVFIWICLPLSGLQADWVMDGGYQGSGHDPSLATDDGKAFVAWHGDGNPCLIKIKYYAQDQWQPLSEGLNVDPQKSAFNPHIIFDDQHRLYAAWHENSVTATQIYVKIHDAGGWQAAGESLNVDSNQSAAFPRMAWYDGMPYATWTENGKIYVKRLNGQSWEQVGGSLNLNPDHAAGWPRIAATADSLFVGWIETKLAYVAKYHVGTWELLGGGYPVAYHGSGRYSFNISAWQTIPYISWENYDTGHWVYAARHNGMAWEMLGENVHWIPSGNGTALGRPEIKIFNGEPYVAYEDISGYGYSHQVLVKHFNGAGWVQDGGVLNSAPRGYVPSMNVMGDTIYVALEENRNSESSKIQLVHYLSPTPSATTTPTYTMTPTLTTSATHTMTPTVTRTATQSATLTGTPTITRTATATPTATRTPTRTFTSTLSPTLSRTSTPLPAFPRGGHASPNPFVPGRGQTMTFCFQFDQAETGFVIRVFSLGGKPVRKLENMREWDGRNETGKLCEGGLYVYQIEAEGRRVSGKVVLIK